MGVSVFSEKSTAGIGGSDRIVLGESSCGNPEACLSVPSAFLTSLEQLFGFESDTLCQRPGPPMKFISAVTCFYR